MTDPSILPEERFTALVEALLADSAATLEPAAKRGFGSTALTIGGKIFAMLVEDRLVAKIPRQRVDALVAADAGERFDPGHGRRMKEWLSLDPGTDEPWLPLAREAMAYVDPET